MGAADAWDDGTGTVEEHVEKAPKLTGAVGRDVLDGGPAVLRSAGTDGMSDGIVVARSASQLATGKVGGRSEEPEIDGWGSRMEIVNRRGSYPTRLRIAIADGH